MTFPLPENPTHVGFPDINKAVYLFLQKYAVPAVPAVNIYRGYANRVSLPKGTNEYIIFNVLSHTRHGTNIDTFDASKALTGEDGTITTCELVEVEVQIDCYSDSDAGRQRATAIEMMARSPYAVQFFKQFGMSCLYADDVRDLTGVTDSDQFVYRHMVTLHLTYTAVISQKLPWFDAVNVNLKNVDVVFPPLD